MSEAEILGTCSAMVLAGTATFLELSNQFEVPRQARGKVIRWNEIIVGAKLVE